MTSGIRLTTAEFVERARVVHNGRYDYSRVEYVNASTKVAIICRDHGLFMQRPNNHVSGGSGCPKCEGNKSYDAEKFITDAKIVHGDRYGYGQVEYVSAKIDVLLECRIHGFFLQRPDNHLHGKGCPTCALGGTDVERFEGFINKNGRTVPGMATCCWEWTGDVYDSGYGRFWFGNKTVRSSRFSYELYVGAIPDNLFVLHRCDNGPGGCVRPDHLFLGDAAANSADMVAKGRSASGEKSGMAKLTWSKVAEIRKMYSSGSWTQTSLANFFNVSQATIGRIVKGEAWKER